MHILEKSSCCIDEKLKLKFVKTVIHLGWPLKVKNSFARKTRYKSVLRTAIVFLTHKEEGKCTNILFPVLCQGVWMINNNKRCNNIYFIFFFLPENNLILPKSLDLEHATLLPTSYFRLHKKFFQHLPVVTTQSHRSISQHI